MLEAIKNLDLNDSDKLNEHKIIVKSLLKKYDNLEKDEIIYLIIFFTKLKIKECGLDIKYEFLDNKNNDNTIAFYSDQLKKVCYYNNAMVDKSIKCGKNLKIRTYGIISNLNTINHEFQHAIQHNFYKNDNIEDISSINSLIFFMAFEDITNKYIKKFHEEKENKLVSKSNYKYNYEDMLFEQDANYEALKNTEDWLKEYCPDLVNNFRFANDRIFTRLSDNRNHLDFIMQKSLTTDEDEISMYKINLITTYAISKDINILSDYPILKIAYNLDGTKKNYWQLKQEKLKNLDKVKGVKGANLERIYDALIKIDPIITIEKLEEELIVAIKGKNVGLIDVIVRKINDIAIELNQEYYQQFIFNINNELEKSYKLIREKKDSILYLSEYIKQIRGVYNKTMRYNLGFQNKKSIELKEIELVEKIENLCGIKLTVENGYIVDNNFPRINFKSESELVMEMRNILSILSSKNINKKITTDEYRKMTEIINNKYQEMINLVRSTNENIKLSDLNNYPNKNLNK